MASKNHNFVFLVGGEKTSAGHKSDRSRISIINKQVALHRHEQRRRTQKQKQIVLASNESSSSAGSSPETIIESSESSIDTSPEGVTGEGSPPKEKLIAAQTAEQLGRFRRVSEPAQRRPPRFLDRHDENEENRLAVVVAPTALRRSNSAGILDTPHSPSIGIQSFLDPFFRLPFQLNEYERSLVHFYFTFVPVASLGLKADGRFCPLRTWISDLAQEYPALLQWILASSEDYISALGGRPDQESMMVKRKSQAYQKLRRAISNADSQPDHALAGMMIAAASDEKNAKIHLRGLEDLILSTGANESFGTVFKLMHPDIFIMTYSFAPCIVPMLKELETSKTGFIVNLTAMNARARWIQAERMQRRLPDAEMKQGVVQEYFGALDRLLSCDCVGPLLRSTYDPTLPYVRRARHFAMLFNFHKVLLWFGGDGLQQQTLFFTKLRQFCRESSARDVNTGAWLLRPGAVVSVICHARSDVLNRFESEKDAFATGVRSSRATMEGLKVFGYLSETSQEFVVTSLRSWLTGNMTHGDEWNSTASKIDNLAAEIVDNWVEQHLCIGQEELPWRA